MKKLLLIILSAALITGLCACNNGTQGDNSSPEQKTAVTDKKTGETSQDELSEIESKAEDSSSDSESKVSQESTQALAEQSDSQTSSKKTEIKEISQLQPDEIIMPSDEIVQNLEKLNESSVSIKTYAEIYSYKYPELTQKQMDKIFLLLDKYYPITPHYDIAVAAGEIDENTPTLTLEKTKQIINEATDENGYTNMEQVLSEIEKIQKYPNEKISTGAGVDNLYYISRYDNGFKKEGIMPGLGGFVMHAFFDENGIETAWEDLVFDYKIVESPTLQP